MPSTLINAVLSFAKMDDNANAVNKIMFFIIFPYDFDLITLFTVA
jgi:hypothetical protein